ncbi:hypothetical protein CJ179_34320 [Rhodococcus sp. ACS1]|jgi:hypothetical protein|uniref:hypothetical protein n=1 Tax=Rhodococcus TaxID=1827 RepID=UPI000BB12AA9|nr:MULTISPECIES: hypothetical protein [Rhodococcus]PBC40129.1 hypothetical protein CJ179_34320 [Rhodococcus sp. ACS1]QSE84935.1 hypothetical protein JWS14_40610 [Rhodococcus koreensis]
MALVELSASEEGEWVLRTAAAFWPTPRSRRSSWRRWWGSIRCGGGTPAEALILLDFFLGVDRLAPPDVPTGK